ncbi:hypothetical protein [Paenibacillus sedimenti]|uniref:hypothetical protein n=1 Tax=Paenibacillus sedimenti TaxID=2770274 RepID=UPI00165F3DDD|nr:hypothetical protein [Paenibacillus sedimenti]
MKKRYPWLSVTFLSCWLFSGFYLITFIVTGTSYSLISTEPADQSREFSSIYYGVMFSVLPYLPMGVLLFNYVGRRPLILAVHTVGIGFLLEKVAFVYLGTLLGTGYPWYGRNFPWNGHAVLCEELPMYCGANYVWNYYIWGTAIALGMFWFGSYLIFWTGFNDHYLKRR